MIPALLEALAFLRQNDLATILARIRRRDVPWVIQLLVYGCCGAAATVLNVGLVVILSRTLIPAYENMLVAGSPITDELRARNLLINNTIAFVVTNFFVYFINILLVFQRGRHHPFFEFIYFTLINGVSFLISQIAGPWLIHQFGVPTNIAILTNAVVSALINFVARKFFVFKG